MSFIFPVKSHQVRGCGLPRALPGAFGDPSGEGRKEPGEKHGGLHVAGGGGWRETGRRVAGTCGVTGASARPSQDREQQTGSCCGEATTAGGLEGSSTSGAGTLSPPWGWYLPQEPETQKRGGHMPRPWPARSPRGPRDKAGGPSLPSPVSGKASHLQRWPGAPCGAWERLPGKLWTWVLGILVGKVALCCPTSPQREKTP